MSIRRWLWNGSGLTAFALGTVGIFVPLLPTVPFYIFAAFCFANGNPVWEARLLNHPRYGPPIRDWRERGVIRRRGKVAATLAFAFSIALGIALLPWPWVLLPPVTAVLCLSWLWTRPEG